VRAASAITSAVTPTGCASGRKARPPCNRPPAGSTTGGVGNACRRRGKRKLSYKDARELEQLPARIEALETRLSELTEAMNAPAFYQRGSEGIATHNATLAATQADLDAAYARWAELDG
jgi:ATP-binding cassette subfamily F protein uup